MATKVLLLLISACIGFGLTTLNSAWAASQTVKSFAFVPKKGPGKKKPNKKKPGNKRPSNKRPGNKKPSYKKPGNKKPNYKRPGNKKPSHKKPGNKRPSNKKPGNKKPSHKKPSNKKPANKKPSNKKPSNKKPSNKKPSNKKPTYKKPIITSATPSSINWGSTKLSFGSHLNGREITPKQLAGKPVLIKYWKQSDEKSGAVISSFAQLAEARRDIQFIAVQSESDPNETALKVWKEKTSSKAVSLFNAGDDYKKATPPAAGRISSFPYAVLLNADGKVVWKGPVNALTLKILEEKIAVKKEDDDKEDDE